MIILYSTHCPQCKALEMKLNKKKVTIYVGKSTTLKVKGKKKKVKWKKVHGKWKYKTKKVWKYKYKTKKVWKYKKVKQKVFSYYNRDNYILDLGVF